MSQAFLITFAAMRKSIAAILILMLGLNAVAAEYPYAKLYKNTPVALEQAQLPVIPDFSVRITDFANGEDCTLAFPKAIKELAKQGGGHLIVPAGTWIAGPIVLKSGIDLHLEEGATIVFTNDKSAYFKKDADGKPIVNGRALPCISADKCTDISITGKGTLNGNGQWWRYAKKGKLCEAEWQELLDMGGTLNEKGDLWFPYNLNSGYPNITDSPEKEEAIRNHLIIIKRSSRVLIQGVTVCNSPKFHINPSQCTDVVLDGVTVKCPWNAQNGDGIDIGNSQRVLVTGCTVDCGDDGICMKGGSGQKGLEAGPCRDILICNNTVLHAHGGFVIGSDYSGGMEKIVVRNCVFDGSDIGLRFKSMPGRGGKCQDIWISDITMRNIPDAAISFRCDYADVSYKTLASGEGKPAEFLPDFSNIHISKVNCESCATGIFASGLAGADCVHEIFISKSRFECSKKNLDVDESTTRLYLKKLKF